MVTTRVQNLEVFPLYEPTVRQVLKCASPLCAFRTAAPNRKQSRWIGTAVQDAIAFHTDSFRFMVAMRSPNWRLRLTRILPRDVALQLIDGEALRRNDPIHEVADRNYAGDFFAV